MEIIPTLLTQDKKAAAKKINRYKGIFSWLQLDIIDNIFVDNTTLSVKDFVGFGPLKYFKPDIHLMTNNPINCLPDCKKIKAKRVIGHIELMDNQSEFIKACQANKFLTGLAVDLPTAISHLNIQVLPLVDAVLLMSVKAGRGGQTFSPLVLAKIKKLSKIKKAKGLKFKIALDGGINDATIKKPFLAGAEIFYVGGFVEKKPKNQLAILKKACYQ